MAQFSETYPMSVFCSDSTSVIHEQYHADDEEAASRLIASQKATPIQKSALHFNPSALSGLRWWLPELFASLLSVGTFVCLTLILRIYDGRALHEIDLPSSLTLNGLIALLATVNRVTLMVPVGSAMSQDVWLWFSSPQSGTNSRARLGDLEFSSAASRGAWGSLLFLFRARPRWLACTSALVTIFSFVFGTFTQQLIANIEVPIISGILQPKCVDRVEIFTNFTDNPAEAPSSIPLGLKAAAYNGILSPDIQPLPASCPTGNCTWPITPSLAICGGCSNSTYELSCNSAADVNMTAHNGYGGSVCSYTMPSGMIANLSSEGENGFQVMQSKGAAYNWSDSSMLYITIFDLVGAPGNSYPSTWSPSSTVAAECAMWFCAQAYNISVTSSQQTQITQNFSKIVSGDWSDSANLSPFSNITFLDLPAEMNQRPDSQFGIDHISAISFSNFLSSLFSGNVTLDLESSSPSSDVIQAVWNATTADLDVWIKNVALSMTNALRVFNPTPEEDMYNGTGYQLGIQVRWRWIILPAVLVMSSLFILIVTVVRTARSPVQAWKGSPLALLFTDVDQDIRKRAEGRMDAYQGLEDAVGRIKMALKNDDSGNWAFKAA